MATTVRPDVTIRTTTGQDDGQGAVVVVGYGPDPAAAVRDLTRCARGAARELAAGADCFEVIGVRLVAGEVPDNDALRAAAPEAIREARRATRPGWAAYGTLTAASRRAG